MSLETKTTLSEETLAHLQDLIQVNIDSQHGFEEVLEKIDDMSLREKFRALASERKEQALELQGLVSANNEQPQDSGSVAAAAHRAWIDLRSALGGGVAAMLSEAERGEDQIKEKYEKVLKTDPGTAVNDVLSRQYVAVKAAHDRVRDLRDHYKQ